MLLCVPGHASQEKEAGELLCRNISRTGATPARISESRKIQNHRPQDHSTNSARCYDVHCAWCAATSISPKATINKTRISLSQVRGSLYAKPKTPNPSREPMKNLMNTRTQTCGTQHLQKPKAIKPQFLPRRPNYPLMYPNYPLLRTIRALLKGH